MAKLLRRLAFSSIALAAVVGAGFVAFAANLPRANPLPQQKADGIVVLTGGEDRVLAGIELVKRNYGRRLLISGVHPDNRRLQDILAQTSTGRVTRAERDRIDLGYHAQNTTGNALEARDWAGKFGFRRLLVVTSAYHMPRSLTEFAEAMPGAELIAHPIGSSSIFRESWRPDRITARNVVTEYFKYLYVSARVGVARLVGAWGPATATHTTGAPKPI